MRGRGFPKKKTAEEILTELGLVCARDESNWSFRRRVFPLMYHKDVLVCAEFFLGVSADEWDDGDRGIYSFILLHARSGIGFLTAFAETFPKDPREMESKKKLSLLPKNVREVVTEPTVKQAVRDEFTPLPGEDRGALWLRIIDGRKKKTKTPVDLYKGQKLTQRLAKFGFDRLDGEGDWAFRRRVFPELYLRDSELAMQFLLGSDKAGWNDFDKEMSSSITSLVNADRNTLDLIAETLSIDPVIERKKRRVGQPK